MEPGKEEADRDRFTERLEAFSDLVFGFSLSLLATRLEVPTSAAGIIDAGKGLGLLITFALICLMWLEHYRIFRRHFVAHRVEVITNFVFLFGLALLPYALQTFLRFPAEPAALALYLADLALIFLSLATLQLRGLLQRRVDLHDALRLRDWQRTLTQFLAALFMIYAVAMLTRGMVFGGKRAEFFGIIVLLVLVGIRYSVRRVPRFLQPISDIKG
jgi:uncharacterized membrane protein